MGRKLYLGIDVSKGYSDFVIIDEQKRIVEPNFQLDDTYKGHSCLYSILSKLCESEDVEMIYAAVESTGSFENNWYHALKRFQIDIPIKTARLNPLGIHYVNKADMQRVITDKTSALSIAKYQVLHPDSAEYDSDEQYALLRRHRTYIKLLKKQKTQLLNQLSTLYYSSFPEIGSYCKSGVPNWILELLKKYPTAKSLSRAKASTVSHIQYISVDKAKELIELARNSVSSCTEALMDSMIKSVVSQIQHLGKIISAQKKQLAAQCSIPEVELLKSIIGISDWTAIGLVIEIGPVERFSTAKKLASYLGLHPQYKQSGDGTSKVQMSKQGRVEGRNLLFMAANSAIMHNPVIQRTYKRHLARGKSHLSALGVCMHKLLRIVYGMLKSGKAFNSAHEESIVKVVSLSIEKGSKKTRRYQSYDANSPISRRQYKNRKADIERQNDNIIEYGVIDTDRLLN